MERARKERMNLPFKECMHVMHAGEQIRETVEEREHGREGEQLEERRISLSFPLLLNERA